MSSTDAAKVMPGGGAKVCDTIEIKIRTLDSQDHVLRVKEWIPIPILKKEIASVTGVSPEDQHLIFDGRIFEDDQRLSTYHVEDGHTLHLLVRQSHQSAAASTNQMESNAYGHPGTSSASGSGLNRGSQVAFGSSLESGQNRSSQGVHGIFTASGSEHQVFHGNSFVSGSGHNLRSQVIHGSEHNYSGQVAHTSILCSPLSDMLDPINSTDTRAGNRANDIRRESQQSDIPCQRDGRRADSLYQNPSNPQRDGQQADFLSSSAAAIGPQNPTVIANSLTTLSLYIGALSNLFRREGFVANVEAGIDRNEGQSRDSHMHAAQVGISSPSYLAELLLSSRQLMEQTRESLYQLAILLEEHTSLTDPLSRNLMQRSAIFRGVLVQNMGSVLLELGRAILTLQLGRTPAEAQVNAGPATYISNMGPTPLMIQVPGPGAGGTNTRSVNSGDVLEVFVTNTNVSEQPFSGGYGIRAVPLRRVISMPVGNPALSDPSANSAQLASLRQARAGNVRDTRGSQSSSQIHQGAFGVFRQPHHQSNAQMENSDSSSGGAARVGVHQQPIHQSIVQSRNLESNSGIPSRVGCRVPSNAMPAVSGLSPPNEFAASQASNQLSLANINSERRIQVNNDTTRGTKSQDAASVFNVVPQLVEFHRRFVREDLNGPPEAQEPQRTMLSERTQAGSGTIRATEPNDAARGSNVLPQQEVIMRQTNNARQIERRDLNVSHRQLGQPAAQSSKCTKNQSNKDGDRRSQANDDATGVMQSHDTTSVGSDGVFSSNAPHPLMPLTSQDTERQISSASPNYSTAQIQRELLNDSSSSQHQHDPFKAPSKKRTKRNDD